MQSEFLCNQLISHGYRRMDTYLRAVTVLWGDREGGPHLVCVVSQAEKLTEWQLVNWRSELERITGITSILFLALTQDVQTARINLMQDTAHWVIGPTGTLFIDEGQPYDFHHLNILLQEIATMPQAAEAEPLPLDNSMLRNSRPVAPVKRFSWKDNVLTVCVLIIAINVILFLVDLMLVYNDGGRLFLDDGPLYYWGVLVANIPAYDHQYYRLFTCMFLHLGVEHLVGNMVTLYFIGNSLEKVVGHLRFTIIYIVGGLVGSVVQYIYYSDFTEEPAAMLGASGAIFAVIGAFLCVLLKNRKSINRTMLPRYILFIALSVYSGVRNPQISLSAHIGGLVAGFALAAILYRPYKANRA